MKHNYTRLLITPEIAKVLLEKNNENRPLDRAKINLYTQEMIEGKWQTATGETIKVAKSGRVLDGQHRLYAIIESGVSLEFDLCQNLPEECFSVIDTGKMRSATDVFFISGISNSKTMPSILAKYHQLKKGLRVGAKKYNKLTNSDALELYKNRSLFWDETFKKTISWYKDFSKILAPAMIGGMYAYFYDINEEQAEQFFDDLTSQMTKNINIALLKKKLIDNKVSTKKINATYTEAYIIKAWNLFRKNQDAKVLSINLSKEQFPVAL